MLLKGTNLDDLFTYFLIIEQFKNDLFIANNTGEYMPMENENEWYSVMPMLMRDLKLRDFTMIDGRTYTRSDLWDFLREIWKDQNHKEIYETAEVICGKWGVFQK